MFMSPERVLTPNNRLKIFIYYVFAFFVIYSTDSLVVGLGLIDSLEQLSYLLIIILGIYLFCKILIKHHGSIKGICAYGFVLSLVFVILSSVVNFDSSLIGPIKLGCLIIGFYIANEMDTKLFIKAFVQWMLVIAVFSLICYAFSNVIINLGFIPTIEGHKEQVFKVMWLSNLRISVESYRNWGPFWEPGAYQAYLIIALVFLLFDDIHIKRKNLSIIILTSTLLTTFSTTGFLAFPFVFVAYMLHNSNSNKRRLGLKIALLLVAVGFVMWFINSEFFASVFSDKFENIEDVDRIVTINYGLQLWMQKPIFGFSSTYIQEMFNLVGYSFSITNTFIANAIVYGAFLGIYSLVAIISFVRSYKTSLLVSLLLAIGLILSLSGEKFIYSPIVCFLMFYRPNNDIRNNPLRKVKRYIHEKR